MKNCNKKPKKRQLLLKILEWPRKALVSTFPVVGLLFMADTKKGRIRYCLYGIYFEIKWIKKKYFSRTHKRGYFKNIISRQNKDLLLVEPQGPIWIFNNIFSRTNVNCFKNICSRTNGVFLMNEAFVISENFSL